jgi:hypothetical protein
MDTAGRVAIIVAAIAATQAVTVTSIDKGWSVFGLLDVEDPNKTVSELQLTTDLWPRATGRGSNCIRQLRRGLEREGFRRSSGDHESLAIMERDGFKVALSCGEAEISATVAGRRGSNTQAVLELIEEVGGEAGLTRPRDSEG